jgi:hypothetical protein
MRRGVVLTGNPCLPIFQTLHDIFELETFAGCAMFHISLQPPNNPNACIRRRYYMNRVAIKRRVKRLLTFSLVQKLRSVRKVFKNEERRNGANNGQQPFENKDPSPSRFPANTIHIMYSRRE